MMYAWWKIFVWLIVCVVEHCLTVPDKKPLCRCEKYKFDGKPFVALWNSPTIGCDFNFSTPVNLKKFGIYENDRQTWDGKRVTVFSSAQLGLYPYYTENGLQVYNGGLPQLVNLDQHLRKARMDIMAKIPDPNYNGLAVIDWEPWRPLWETNWNKKRIYKVKSVENVRRRYPYWPLERLIEQAKMEFERSGRVMFEQTINLGKELRPNAMWGFYGFPDCYSNKQNRYQCNDQVKEQNDKLDWLYASSTALFPSMYLLEEHPDNRDYVLGRLRETLRFVNKGLGKTRDNVPVFVYHRNIYERDPFAFNFLSKKDLDNTVGLAADLGAAGVVIWGNRFDENTSPHICQMINEYVRDTFGPYIQHKMREGDTCSAKQCGHEGRCINRSLLPPSIVAYYEQNRKLNACFKPIKSHSSFKRDSIVRLMNGSHQNTTRYNNNMKSRENYSSNDYIPLSDKGELGDIGASIVQRKRVNHTIMDDFFRQFNGTSPSSDDVSIGKNTTTLDHLNSTKDLNNNFTSHHVPVNGSHIINGTNEFRNNLTTGVTLNNSTASPNQNLHQSNETVQNRTSSTEFRLGKHSTVSGAHNVKKSSIPHPSLIKNPTQNQHRQPVGNQQKSDITQQIMSGMTGNVIRIADLFRPAEKATKRHHNNTSNSTTVAKEQHHRSNTIHGTNNRMNSSRKSEIYQTSGGHLPLMSTRGNHHSWLPHIYVILIGVTLGGALLFSLIFIGAYYYVTLKNTLPTAATTRNESHTFHQEDNSDIKLPSLPPQAHSSPKGGGGGVASVLEKKHNQISKSRSLRSLNLNKDNSADSTNSCQSKPDHRQQKIKSQIPSYRRSKSANELNNKDKLDKQQERNKTNRSSRFTCKDEEGSEIEINVHDLK